MTFVKKLKSAALAALLLSAGMANAALYQYQLSGDYAASWRLDTVAGPDYGADGLGLVWFDVAGSFPGSAEGVADVTFYAADFGGGVELFDFYGDQFLVVTDGQQLYSGPESNPLLALGAFALTQFNGSGNYVLTVTDLDALPDPVDVPEPATGALLIGGLGLLYAQRRRQQAA